MFNCKINELSISIPTKSQISKYNSGGRPSRPGDLPFEGFLKRREVPPNLMGPPKILYPSVRSEAVPIYLILLTNWFIKICFGFIQICVKTFNMSLIATGFVVT